MKKQCSKCQEWKEKSEFSKDSRSPDRLRGECRECIRVINQEWYMKNKDHIKQYKKKYRQQNKELIREREKRYCEQNKDHKKQYYEQNKERILKRCAKYRDKKWFDGNRIKALKRDNYTCQICGKPANLVHHKDGSGLQTKYPTVLFSNNELNNLITLGRGCHNKTYEPTKIRR